MSVLKILHILAAIIPLVISLRSPDDIYNECGITKGCFGSPENCVQEKSCDYMATYILIDENIVFELQTVPQSGEVPAPKFVASALSTDQQMGEDSVIECVEENGQISAYVAWTNGRENPPFGSFREDIPQDIIRVIDTSFDDGIIYCKLEKDAFHVLNDNQFDTLNTPYYLFISTGSLMRDTGIGRHNIGRKYSENLIDFTIDPGNNEENPDNPSPPIPPTSPQPPEMPYSIYDGCGSTKGCFGFPNGCVATQTCQYVAAFYSDGEKMNYEMQTMTGRSLYIATAISDDDRMGEDSAIECVYQNDDVSAYASWTLSPNNEPSAERDGIDQSVLSIVEKSYENGNIYCKVVKDFRHNMHYKEFNVLAQKYYFLMASGTSIRENGINIHDLGKIVSDQALNLTHAIDILDGAPLSDFIKIHAAFMITAWIGTGACGMIVARYFKKTWIGQQINAKDLWFSWHVILMCSTWVLHLSSFITIFVYVNGFSQSSNPHAILGIATTVFVFLQPIGGLFRPGPKDKGRKVFNVMHWFGGTAAHILAIVTMFFAVTLAKAELPEVFYWILTAFVGSTILAHTMLTISSVMVDRSKPEKFLDLPLQEDSHSIFRQLTLTIYVIICLGCTVTLIVLATT